MLKAIMYHQDARAVTIVSALNVVAVPKILSCMRVVSRIRILFAKVSILSSARFLSKINMTYSIECSNCLYGSYIVQPCNKTHDTICTPCTVCGPMQFYLERCEAGKNAGNIKAHLILSNDISCNHFH